MNDRIAWKMAVERNHPAIFMDFLIRGQSREYVFRTTGFDFAFQNLKKYPFSENIGGKRYFGTLYMDTAEIGALGNIIENRIEKEGIRLLDEYIKKCFAQSDTFIETSKRISQISNLHQLEGRNLARLFSKYAEEAFKMASFLLTIIVAQFVLEKRFKMGLERLMTKKSTSYVLEDYMLKLSIPSKETPEVENIWALISLGAEIQRNHQLALLFNEEPKTVTEKLPIVNPNLWAMIQEYVNKYCWMQPMYYRGEPMQLEDALMQIKSVLRRDCVEQLRIMKANKERSIEQFEKTIQEVSTEVELVSIVKAIREFLYLRTYRLEVFFMANHHASNLLHEIASRLGVSYDDVLFLKCEEILRLLRNGEKAPFGVIGLRKRGYATTKIAGKIKWYAGDSLEAFIRTEPSETLPTNEVKGVVASRGKALGRAKLIITNEDMPKIEQGEILVTTMTTPSLMLALQRAGGIVTNEGGITCHAAIVSRELGIPCVIGTQFATKIFKDNDLLEVNAFEGVVRKVLEV